MKTTLNARPSSSTGCVTVEVMMPVVVDIYNGEVACIHHPRFEDVQAAYDKQLAATEPTRGETD